MQTCRVWTVAVALCLLVPALPHAQWPAHPDRNVPRTPDGRVNLAGANAEDRRRQA